MAQTTKDTMEMPSVMMQRMKPAVAMPAVPTGIVFLAEIAKIKPTTDMATDTRAPQPIHINTQDTIPKTKAAMALPLPGIGAPGGGPPGYPPYGGGGGG